MTKSLSCFRFSIRPNRPDEPYFQKNISFVWVFNLRIMKVCLNQRNLYCFHFSFPVIPLHKPFPGIVFNINFYSRGANQMYEAKCVSPRKVYAINYQHGRTSLYKLSGQSTRQLFFQKVCVFSRSLGTAFANKNLISKSPVLKSLATCAKG